MLERLYGLYSDNAPPPATTPSDSKFDEDVFFATPMGVEASPASRVDAGCLSRAGVAVTLKAIGEARAFGNDAESAVHNAFSFLVEHGLADYDSRVRGHALAAGVAVITAYGEDGVVRFLETCEAVMAERPRKSEDAQCFDWRRAVSYTHLTLPTKA